MAEVHWAGAWKQAAIKWRWEAQWFKLRNRWLEKERARWMRLNASKLRVIKKLRANLTSPPPAVIFTNAQWQETLEREHRARIVERDNLQATINRLEWRLQEQPRIVDDRDALQRQLAFSERRRQHHMTENIRLKEMINSGLR